MTGNIADGAITMEKLAANSVSRDQMVDNTITAQQIAPGAVSITSKEVVGPFTSIPPGGFGVAAATCPAGTALTGGRFSKGGDVNVTRSFSNSQNGQPNVWLVAGSYPSSATIIGSLGAFAECATIHP
jgi:hypothetical protein